MQQTSSLEPSNGTPAAEQWLLVADRVPRTAAEGPGLRYALWVQGCPLRCPGCCNPHMLEFRGGRPMRVHALAAEILAVEGLEGVTFLGGEPFAHAATLAELAAQVRAAGLSVMVFSGFTIEHLRAARRADWDFLLARTDLLVDGPYVQELHSRERRWIGSSNQRVHFLTERYRHLDEAQGGWPRQGNRIEIRLSGTQLTVNGFPSPELSRWLQRP